jgi:hypothetical protein
MSQPARSAHRFDWFAGAALILGVMLDRYD